MLIDLGDNTSLIDIFMLFSRYAAGGRTNALMLTIHSKRELTGLYIERRVGGHGCPDTPPSYLSPTSILLVLSASAIAISSC